MEKQTVTIYDVAREAGVSMATVSRVVNGNPNVKPSTRQKVSEVIERLNYRPNAVARGLASRKTTTIGVIIPNIADIFYSSLARGIDDIATMYKYDIILTTSDNSPNREIKGFNNLMAKQVDGLIYMGHEVTDELKKEITSSPVPVVIAGTDVKGSDFYSVNIDSEKAFEDATQILLDRHDRIALITEDGSYLEAKNQLQGYKNALAERDLAYDDDLVLQQNFKHTDSHKLVKHLEHSQAQAALVYNDYLSVAILNELQDVGLTVPEDFEIITAQNSVVTELVRPTLSSVQQPLYDIGAVAMRLLTKLMNDEEVDERQVILPHKIKLRASTLNE